jgi:hypothetical protein
MRELRPAIHPLLDVAPVYGGGESNAFPLSRPALLASVVLHAGGLLLTGLIVFRSDDLPQVLPSAEFVWLDTRVPPPSPPLVDEPRVVETPVPPTVVETESREPPAEPLAPPQALEEAPPVVVPTPVEPVVEAEPSPAVEPRLDFEAERKRAASEVIEQREREGNYLTFTIRDVAPERVEEEPEVPSIFDGSGASAPRGPTVGRLGQTKTRFGARLAALCNAVSNGGFSLMGWGSFCASPDDEPSGLFPELMPEYLTLKPECTETRPLAAELGEESPFPTIKCELVPRVDVGRWAFPDEPLLVAPTP